MTAPTLARTDADGRASALWRLGLTEGAQQLAATSPSLPDVVTFSATGQGRVRPTDNVDRSAGIVLAPVTVRAATIAVGASHHCRIEGAGGKAKLGQPLDNGHIPVVSTVMLNSETARRQVEANGGNAGKSPDLPLDLPKTTAAMRILHHEAGSAGGLDLR